MLYPEKNPQEIYILDQPELSKAKNVWRWNLAGLGHSSTGVNGKFTTAITADGQIVADFITAGELTGAILKAGTVYAEALDVEYRNAVTKYADDAANKAYEDSLSKIQTTAEEITLLCKKISETAMHNYATDFTDDLSTPWYASSANNVVESSTTLGRYAKIVKASANYNSYIRCNTKKTPAGTYRVRYKAATIAGQENTARVQCSFKTTATTAAGALKSDEWTTFERDIELSSDYDGYIYFYATVLGTTVLIKDVEVLGLLRDYAEAQLTVNADNITAEVKRAQDAEKELKASIKVNTDNITSCVTKDNVGSYITQYYNNVIVAFNNSSKYVQLKAGEINIYNGKVDAEHLRSQFDEVGNRFWRDNYYVGCIGTNQWSGNNAHKGLVFDLEYQGKYMAWARQAEAQSGSYTTVLCYSRANSIYTDEGLHLGAKLYAHGFEINGANHKNSSANGYTVADNKRVSIVTEIHDNGDGTIGWTTSSITVRDGSITGVPDSSTEI